jgi:hypothetical protein
MTITTERPGKAPRAPKEPKAPKAARIKEPKAPKAAKIKVTKAPKEIATAAPKEATWPSPVRPSAMLLPPKVAGRRLHQRAVKQSLIAAAAAAALLGLIYIPVAAATAAAQGKLDEQTATAAEHRSYLSANDSVQKFFDGFITRRQAVADALVKDVSYSAVLKAINDANKVGASFTEIHVSAKTAKPISGEPFAASKAVGYLEVSGMAADEHAVSELMGSLAEKNAILTDPYLIQSGVARGGTAFKFSIGFTDKAMSFKGETFRPSDQELASLDPGTQGTDAAAANPATTTSKDSK